MREDEPDPFTEFLAGMREAQEELPDRKRARQLEDQSKTYALTY